MRRSAVYFYSGDLGKEENPSPVASWRERRIEEQDKSGSDPASLVSWMSKDW
jgi:hypothetical protein